jgi:acetylornithine deacetylase
MKKLDLNNKIEIFINVHKDKILPMLADLVSFTSEHGEEYKVQNYLAQEFIKIGYDAELVSIDDSLKEDPEYTSPAKDLSFKGRPNLIIKAEGKGNGRSIIFNSHNDVVPAKGWEKAYKPEINGNNIIGRGVSDDKHGALLQYMVALFLKERGIKTGGDIIFEMVIDEEVGGNGSLSLIRQGYLADGVIILETSDLNIYAGSRGALWFKAEFIGKSAHMAQIHLGISAIEMALHFVELMKEYQERLRKDGSDMSMFPYNPIPAQVNIGAIHGGDWPSTVASNCVIEGGVGFLPPRTCEDIRKEMAVIIKNDPDSHFRDNVEITYYGLHNEPFQLDKSHPLVCSLESAIKKGGWEPKILASIASSDARLFAKIGKMPTVSFSPPRKDGNAHGTAEMNNLEDILDAFRALIYFLEDWCGLY